LLDGADELYMLRLILRDDDNGSSARCLARATGNLGQDMG
jgi:hypothetical protein